MKNDMKEPTQQDFLEKTLTSNTKTVRKKCQLRICTETEHFKNSGLFKHANMEGVPSKAKNGYEKQTGEQALKKLL